MSVIGQRKCTQECPSQPCKVCAEVRLLVHPVPSLPRAEIERLERHHFPELFEVCHTPVLPKPAVLQALWRNCTDY